MSAVSLSAATTTLRLARFDDLDRIHGLHVAGRTAYPPGVVRPDGPEYLRSLIAAEGCVAAEFEGIVVGYGGFMWCGPGESDLAAALGMTDIPVAHVESSAVRFETRGTGLHRRIIEWRLRRLRERDDRPILASVSPRNHPSLRNLILSGFVLRASAPLYGGLLRFILEHDSPHAPASATESVRVATADEERCVALLREGWIARSSTRLGDRLELVFER